MSGARPAPLRILVAGASAGIGAALVRALASDGHRVFACARRLDRLRAVTEQDSLARSTRCDLANERDVEDLFAWLVPQTSALDALIFCAGAFGPIGPFEGTDSEGWLATLRTNVFGVYLLAKHGLPLLERARLERGRPPRILTFSGGGAFGTFDGYTAYATSKAAVVRLTECLAAELRGRINVNAMAPGMVATEIHEATLRAGPDRAGAAHFEQTRSALGGGGVPVAVPVDCVRFLLSEAADALTGKTIAANFDPWREKRFSDSLDAIAASEVYTLRRINPSHLSDGTLKDRLS